MSQLKISKMKNPIFKFIKEFPSDSDLHLGLLLNNIKKKKVTIISCIIIRKENSYGNRLYDTQCLWREGQSIFLFLKVFLKKAKSTFSSLHFQVILILVLRFYFYHFQSLFLKTHFVLVLTVISVTEISYVMDGIHCQHIKCLHDH